MRHYMVDPENEERLLKIPPRVVAAIKAEALDAAEAAVAAYADETHNCVREYGTGACLPHHGDRCDITASLRVVGNRINDLKEKP